MYLCSQYFVYWGSLTQSYNLDDVNQETQEWHVLSLLCSFFSFSFRWIQMYWMQKLWLSDLREPDEASSEIDVYCKWMTERLAEYISVNTAIDSIQSECCVLVMSLYKIESCQQIKWQKSSWHLWCLVPIFKKICKSKNSCKTTMQKESDWWKITHRYCKIQKLSLLFLKMQTKRVLYWKW